MELIQYARNEIRRHLITLEKHYLKKSKFLLGSDGKSLKLVLIVLYIE